MRIGVLTLAALGVVACDTMIANQLIVRTSADVTAASATQDAVTAVRATLAACGLQRSAGHQEEVWVWHDTQHPPDVHVTIGVSSNRVRIRLVQGLYGPIGPTEKYREIRTSLLQDTRQRYGKANVELE